MTSLCLSLLLAASAQVWLEPSWVDVLDVATRSDGARHAGRLDVARGGWVSFQVVVAARDMPLDAVTIEPPTFEGLPPPAIHRVGLLSTPLRSGRAYGSARYRPDPLVPAAPVNLAADSYAVFWVTYHAPADATPGTRRGTLRVHSPSRKRGWRASVRLVVHPFAQPAGTLPHLAPLDPEAIGRTTGLSLESPEAWSGVAQFLSEYGVQPWPVSGVSIPGVDGGVALDPDDPTGQTLRLPEGRRLALDGLRLNPSAATEVVAVPLNAWSVALAEAHGTGGALRPRAPLAAAWRVEPEGGASLATAFDGSPHTAWRQEAPQDRTTLEVIFPEMVQVEAIEIDWVPGHEAEVLEVLTARAGLPFSSARTQWRFRAGDEPYGVGTAVGTLRYPQAAEAVRVTWGRNPAGRALAVAEFRVAPPSVAGEIPATAPPPEALWLRAEADLFPSTAADAHPMEARALAWLCQAHRLQGVILPGFAAFPEAWQPVQGGLPLIWDLPNSEFAPLCYPAPGGLLPSVRLMRLREGAQDHAWLALLAAAAGEGRVADPALLALLGARLYNPQPDAAALDAMREALLRHRGEIARALSRAVSDRGGRRG